MSHRSHPVERPHDTALQLARLLELPHLAQVVPHLAPDVLHRWIRHAGIDRCFDLLDAATPAQLTTILDLDLWTGVPGQDETFDAGRFGEWVENLVDHDPVAAARLIVRFDREMVITGLADHLRVLDPGVLEPTAPSDDEVWDHPLFATDRVTANVGGYLVQARRTDAWDAIVMLLAELASEHPACFHALMRGCRRLSDAGREQDGLDHLLEQAAQWRHDLFTARDDRRVGRGFTSAADARAFLARARLRAPGGLEAAQSRHPIAASYLESDLLASEASTREPASTGLPEALAPEVAAALADVVQVLTAEGLIGDRPHAGLLAGAVTGEDNTPPDPGLRPLLDYVGAHAPGRFLVLGQELAFLANTLVAGSALQTRAFTPHEAADAVGATCSLGLLSLTTRPSADYLVTHGVVELFELGWARLHRDVSLFVANELLTTLRQLPRADSPTLAGLRALRRSLIAHVADGRPWLVHDDLDVLSTLDTPSWYGLLGLLAECPVLPAVVTAIVERSTGRIDPQQFTFFSTEAQLQTVRTFMKRLPDLLAS